MTSLKQISNKFSGITFNFEAGERDVARVRNVNSDCELMAGKSERGITSSSLLKIQWNPANFNNRISPNSPSQAPIQPPPYEVNFLSFLSSQQKRFSCTQAGCVSYDVKLWFSKIKSKRIIERACRKSNSSYFFLPFFWPSSSSPSSRKLSRLEAKNEK